MSAPVDHEDGTDDRARSHGYHGGMTAGGIWGCAAAALIGAPLFMFLLIVNTLGDCAPGEQCHPSALLHVVIPTAIVALVVGLGVREVVNRLRNGG